MSLSFATEFGKMKSVTNKYVELITHYSGKNLIILQQKMFYSISSFGWFLSSTFLDILRCTEPSKSKLSFSLEYFP